MKKINMALALCAVLSFAGMACAKGPVTCSFSKSGWGPLGTTLCEYKCNDGKRLFPHCYDGNVVYYCYDEDKAYEKKPKRCKTKNEVAAEKKKREKEEKRREVEELRAKENAEKKIAADIMKNSGTLTDARDGKTYRTIKIGNQVWMAENLNYESKKSFCYWNGSYDGGLKNNPELCAKFGRIYKWAAAMDSVGEFSENGKGCGMFEECNPTYPVRGICPEGWHLPTKGEFETLLESISKDAYALKSTSGWKDGRNGTNASGFSAIPTIDVGEDSLGRYTMFWTATQIHNSEFGGSTNAYQMTFSYIYQKDGRLDETYGKHQYFSVRCVKDE